MDIRCFLGSLGVLIRDKNIIEGGTGIHSNSLVNPDDDVVIFKEDKYQEKR